MKTQQTIDWRTLTLGAVMIEGLIWASLRHASGDLPTIWACVLGTVFMNLSFTAWHESSHQNFSLKQGWNTAFGVLMSFASIYPGYFARRREHLAHHRFEADAVRDPVYARIQCSLWAFPFRLFLTIFDRSWLKALPANFVPMTTAQVWADRVSNLLAFGGLALAWRLGYGATALWVWFIPRAIVYGLHAVYICWFPHHKEGGGYQVYRIISPRSWAWWATMGQSLHGMHHRWPSIPWHGYSQAFREQAKNLKAEGFDGI